MPIYRCTFVTEQGRYVRRDLFAESKAVLRESHLHSEDKLLYIRRSFSSYSGIKKLLSGKIKYSQFLLFNQELIIMLKAGMPFTRALEIITQNVNHQHLRDTLTKANLDIRNGIPISEAFNVPDIPFGRIYRACLMAGERSGKIEQVLERFNDYLAKISHLRKKTVSSLMYPIVLFVFMIAMVNTIMLYVIPKFSEFFTSFEADLPAMTIMLVSLSEFMRDNFVWITAVLVGSYYGIRYVERINPKVIFFDQLKLRLPFMGPIIAENALAVFSRTLAILITGGIAVPESAQISIETFGNRFLFSKVAHIPEQIREGKLLSQVLGESPIITPIIIEMVRVGESSGNLVDVLNECASYYERSVDSRISILISLIEPVIIIIMGLTIAFMLAAVYLPIFSAVRVIQ
jgi:type IV pilus assembly protein PilC